VLLKYALESLPNPEDEKTVALLVSRLDHDGDGKISAEEFVSGSSVYLLIPAYRIIYKFDIYFLFFINEANISTTTT